MTNRTTGAARLAAAALVVAAGAALAAQATIPLEFHGDWVPTGRGCQSPVKLRVAAATLTLVNGTDSQTWGNVGVPASFFGHDYEGISVVALPDFDATQPFTVYFNAEERKGVTKVSIYTEMRGPMNPQLAKLQADAKKLASRFPLNDAPLERCPAAK